MAFGNNSGFLHSKVSSVEVVSVRPCMGFIPSLSEMEEESYISSRTIWKHAFGAINTIRMETNINFHP